MRPRPNTIYSAQIVTRLRYERMLGQDYEKCRFSHALEFLGSLVVPNANDSFDYEQDTDPEVTVIGPMIKERRPAR